MQYGDSIDRVRRATERYSLNSIGKTSLLSPDGTSWHAGDMDMTSVDVTSVGAFDVNEFTRCLATEGLPGGSVALHASSANEHGCTSVKVVIAQRIKSLPWITLYIMTWAKNPVGAAALVLTACCGAYLTYKASGVIPRMHK